MLSEIEKRTIYAKMKMLKHMYDEKRVALVIHHKLKQ